MNEACCQLGQDRRLAGIVTEPSVPSHSSGRTGVVLVSAGLVPKDGPFRLYAELARNLASDGFTTLRLDLSGIGDSPRSRVTLPLRARTELEIRAAVDHLTKRYGLRRVILGGLCSGAEDSFRFAEVDRRVAGVVMIDPFAYKTRGWQWRDRRRRLTRRCARALGLYQPYPPRKATNGSLVSYTYMDPTESTRILRTLVKRGVHVHFAYTGGGGVFNHEGQLQAMFEGIDFGGHVTLDYFPRLDHTQVLSEHRRELVNAVAQRLAWAAQRMPSAAHLCAAADAVAAPDGVFAKIGPNA